MCYPVTDIPCKRCGAKVGEVCAPDCPAWDDENPMYEDLTEDS